VTLCFVLAGSKGEVLLSRAAPDRDRFPGLWNGVGGHVEPGEDVRAAALRELREETGLAPERIELRAVIHESALLGRAHLLFVFRAELTTLASGSLRAPGPSSSLASGSLRAPRRLLDEVALPPAPTSREGTLAWFAQNRIPWEHVVPDLRALLPRVLEPGGVLFGVQEFDGGDRALRLELA